MTTLMEGNVGGKNDMSTTSITNTSFPVESGESVTSVEVTTFLDATLAPGFSYDNLAPNHANDLDDTHTLVEILRRPVLMLDKVVTSATPLITLPKYNSAQKSIFNISLPWDVIKKGNKGEKISRFEYFRADAVIKITVNANNMTAGRFFLSYAPYDALIDRGYRQEDKHAAGVTSYPGVELDIQINNTVEIRVPYLHWAEMLSITLGETSESTYASVQLFALTPIRSVSSYPITIQVWSWFENISVVGPTCDAMNVKLMSESELIKEQLYHAYLRKQEFEMQIQSEAGSGPISSIASTVSGVASAISGIPVIGEVASTVSWVADIVGGVASIFGWSRPINMDRTTRIDNTPGYGMCHVDTIDNATVLGLTSQNELGSSQDAFPTNVDEMALDYVVANPSMISVVEWKKTSVSGTQLVRFPVSAFPEDNRTGDDGLLACSSFEYVAQLFQYWRATICYRISVVKTPYHSGRLEILFVPNKKSNLSITMDTSNTYRYILDITNETEITVKVPFLSESLMIPTTSSIGSLYIRTITQLHCPDVVDDTVDVVVWKWAEQVCFSGPVSSVRAPYPLPNTPVKRGDMHMQINVGNVSTSRAISFFPRSDDEKKKLEILQNVGGEAVINLRSLLKGFRYAGHVDVEANKLTIYQVFLTEPRDYVNYLAQMYRFARGGMGIKFYARDTKGSLRTSVNNTDEHEYVDDYFYRSPTHITYNSINPVHQIAVPYYGKYRRVPTVPVAASGLSRVIYPSLMMNSSEKMIYDVYRAGKDDLNFGCLVGPPVLRNPASLKSVELLHHVESRLED